MKDTLGQWLGWHVQNIFCRIALLKTLEGLINKDLEMQRQAKMNDKNRRFGVIMTPL